MGDPPSPAARGLPTVPVQAKPSRLQTTPREAGDEWLQTLLNCAAAGERAARRNSAHVGQAPQGERSHRPAVSSDEPQVSGFGPCLLHVYLARGRVAVSGVCVATGVMIGGFMGWGSWPPSTGERNPGEEGSVPTSEFCHSAGPEVARTVWAKPGRRSFGLSPKGTA